jgi:hypothetical protein
MSKNDGTHPDIPEKSWTNNFPEQHPLHDLYERRIRNQQDLVILVDDWHARRGTGKTVASLQLAEAMDQNDGLTKENVAISPEELRGAYTSLPKQSALVLDEGEIGASNRDAMTKTNKALREIMSIGRVEQKYVIINTPDVGFLDKDIRQLSDVWMTMLTKGYGLIHYLKRQPYANKLLTEAKATIQFRDIQTGTDLRKVYNWLTAEKKKHIGGDEGDNYIERDEHREIVEKAVKEAKKAKRNEVITALYEGLSDLDDDDYTRMKRAGGAVPQTMLGEAIGLSQQQIGTIVNSD